MFLPCPFCGESPHYSVYQDVSLWSHNIVDWHDVKCWGCDISMHQCEDLDELEIRWNQRSNQGMKADPNHAGRICGAIRKLIGGVVRAAYPRR